MPFLTFTVTHDLRFCDHFLYCLLKYLFPVEDPGISKPWASCRIIDVCLDCVDAPLHIPYVLVRVEKTHTHKSKWRDQHVKKRGINL